MSGSSSEVPPDDPSASADLEDGFGRSEVLVVDDDRGTLAAVEVALDGIDADLVVASTAEEALRAVSRGNLAVVLLDVRLPSMSGLEVARRIRKRASIRHLPIIFMTAHDGDEEMRRGYELGAVDFLVKPFVIEVLRAKVQVFVELHNRAVALRSRDVQLRRLEREAAECRLEEARLEWEAAALRQAVAREREEKVKLEDVDRRRDAFLALLAHELRNPLVPLVTGLERIRAQVDGIASVKSACEAMDRQVDHIVRLVDDLLDMSQIAEGKVELRREPVDVRGCIEHGVEMCTPVLERAGHRVHLGLGATPLVCFADPFRVTQVLGNVLANMARDMSRAGDIRIAAGIDGSEVVVRVRAMEGVREAALEERMAGARLDAGSLGLAIARRVAELHGGRLHVRNGDSGVQLELTLPRTDEAADIVPRDSPPISVNPVRRRVLVVEDSEDVRELMHELLVDWGHEVHVVRDGRAAIEAAASLRPDVVLLDIGLPDLDGYDVALRIRGALAGARPLLVAFTAFGREDDRIRSLDAGFDAHLVKPPRLDVLREILGRARPNSDRVDGGGSSV